MDIITNLFLDLSFWDIAIKLFFGAVIGVCLGLTGVGGGVLIIPILQVVFGMHAVLAVGTASVIASLVKLTAAFSHIRVGNVDWKYVIYMLMGAIPITLITAHFIVALSNAPEYSVIMNNVIEILIISVMSFSMISMIMKMKSINAEAVASTQDNGSRSKAVFSGAFCGSVLGSTGIGGGVLLLPMLNSVLGVSIKKSVGSSIVIALVLSAICAFNYSHGGQSDIPTALMLVLGSLLGVPLAIRLVSWFSEKVLYQITIAIIAVSLFITVIY
ncbi:sulfite exporter TauE/SafE family protein [Photobacterium sagamiensis]|uniref:sulfite exporter TauE/SafE family protein n=1 Tax=Photobacterium sagamiensis TaxID=2910241 RepID=UPI003D10578D